MILLILNDNGGKIYVINDLFNKQNGISFASTDKVIKCALYKNHSFLGYGEVTINKEAKWINFSNSMSLMKNNTENQEVTQLRLKCTIVDKNKKKIKQPASITNHSVKPSNNLNNSMMKDKSKSISIKKALLSPGSYSSNNHLSVNMQKALMPKHYNKSNLIGLKLLIRKNKQKYCNSNKTCNESSYENNNLLTCDDNTSYMNATLKTATNYNIKQFSEMKQPFENSSYLSSAKNVNNKRNNTSSFISNYSTKKPIISQSKDKIRLFTTTNQQEEKFESIEEKIIDKKFEYNICKDEMIINQEKSLNNCSFFYSDCESKLFETFYEEQIFKDEKETEFENLKDDVEILYTKEYLDRITNDLISLELQLFIDKMCELQEAYYIELNKAFQKNIRHTNILQCLSEKYVLLKKSVNKLKNKNDINNIKQVMNTDVIKKMNKQIQDIISTNSKEVYIWKFLDLFVKKKHLVHKESKKKQFVNIFKTIIRKNKGFNFANEKLCDKIMMRYNVKTDIDNNDISQKKEEMLLFSQQLTAQKKKIKIHINEIYLKRKNKK